MGYNVELPDGSAIVLLYTKNFEWKDESRANDLGNAPFTGRIYRALKTAGDNNYYVHLELPVVPGKVTIEGIRLTKLSYNTPEWNCEFEEINDNNIIDFDINSEDYQKIGKWLETKQQDLIDHLFKRGIDVAGSESDMIEENPENNFSLEDMTGKIMDVFKSSLVPYDNKCIEAIQWIGLRDPFALQAITFLLTEYANFLHLEDKGPLTPLQRDVATSAKLGKAANIAYIAKSLDDHVRNKLDDKYVVFSMFLPLIFELMRQELNPSK